jgi:hypothetical protein
LKQWINKGSTKPCHTTYDSSLEPSEEDEEEEEEEEEEALRSLR